MKSSSLVVKSGLVDVVTMGKIKNEMHNIFELKATKDSLLDSFQSFNIITANFLNSPK